MSSPTSLETPLSQIKTLNLSALKQAVKQWSTMELSLAVSQLQPLIHPEDATHLTHLVAAIQNKRTWKSLGEALNPSQLNTVLQCMDTFTEEQLENATLLFTTLQPLVFRHLLAHPEVALQKQLKKLVHFEPLQHQLLILSHTIQNKLDEIHIQLSLLVNNIILLSNKKNTLKEIHQFISRIENNRQAYLEQISLIDEALALAWNSSRKDLIETFGTLKEHCLTSLQLHVGTPRSGMHPPQGCYMVLETELGNLFGDPEDPLTTSLRDHEPAIEALAALGIWNEKDYQAHNLLTNEELSQLSDEEKVRLVNSRLHSIGLKNVADFKEKYIFTKSLLKELTTNQFFNL